jgi:hypothetical protein
MDVFTHGLSGKPAKGHIRVASRGLRSVNGSKPPLGCCVDVLELAPVARCVCGYLWILDTWHWEHTDLQAALRCGSAQHAEDRKWSSDRKPRWATVSFPFELYDQMQIRSERDALDDDYGGSVGGSVEFRRCGSLEAAEHRHFFDASIAEQQAAANQGLW